MKKIERMTGQYNLSKTIRMALIPEEKTLENFEKNRQLDADEQLNQNYQKVKKIIDRYHKYYLECMLSNPKPLEALQVYAGVYYGKAKRRNQELEKLEDQLRKEVADHFKNVKQLFGREMFTKLLPEFLQDPEELEIVQSFSDFTTYFTGFNENRENMYTAEKKSTGIAYRCINNNLPRFLDNVKSFRQVKEQLPETVLQELEAEYQGICGTTLTDLFSVDYFHFVLSQSGIERYNDVIGGYTTENGAKVQGINEKINLYNQTADKEKRLPKMKPLYKQILSDRETISFIPEQFENDTQLLSAVYEFYNTDRPQTGFTALKNTLDSLSNLFDHFEQYDLTGIFIKNDAAVTELSVGLCGSWSKLRELWNEEYALQNKPGKSLEKYEEKRAKAYKACDSFSLSFVQNLLDRDIPEAKEKLSVQTYYKELVSAGIHQIFEKYQWAEKLLTFPYDIHEKSLKNDDQAVAKIKEFLDAIKDLERQLKPLSGAGKEADKNEMFYGAFLPILDAIGGIDRLYDKIRNYVTQKPYTTDKIKLNFNSSQLLSGWDQNKEPDNLSILLRKGQSYFLAIMDKKHNKSFKDISFEPSEDCYQKIVYKLLPGPNKMLPKVFFAKSNIAKFAPSEEIMRIYTTGTFKKGDRFSLQDCHKLIDFYKRSIALYEKWSMYDFSFRETEKYADISEFYKDVQDQGYKISFVDVPTAYIDQLVDEGKLYLFKIYNKDFSEHSKGTPNLHTLYFKMLFDARNFKNTVYQLNGGAEVFYRPASIKKKDIICHPAHQPIQNKNPHTEKRSSVFAYDLIKDKRFTEPRFLLHLPMKLNFKAPDFSPINDTVKTLLQQSEHNFVIGIDRGERHLIYVSVVDDTGKIVEQYSFNKIINEYKEKTHEIDYHALLDQREKERQDARRNWKSIEGIKNLKEGYISQVVQKICKLAVKYDAVIAMEDLNSGFKRSRTKVEKQVYQKFEKMLIDKLNYYVDKHADPEQAGGLLRAYQLTNKFVSFQKMGLQNGFIFYIPAWLTSKIDPVTGFVDLLKPHYKSVDAAKEFVSRFDRIAWDQENDYFEFSFDYGNFPRGTADYRRKWTVCSNGERIESFRDPSQNNQWTNRRIHLTQEFKNLFEAYGIDISLDNLIDPILAVNEKAFFVKLMKLFGLTLQMRNSITNDEEDYLISPVRDRNGNFFTSVGQTALPCDADANGAYNIARKAQWAIAQIKQAPDIHNVKLSISNKQWLEFAQRADLNG